MIIHLERGRINLPGALASPHAAVRRQACSTMSFLLVSKFSAKQLEVFAPLWVGPLTRLLWTDGDAAVVAAAAAGLHQMVATAVLRQAVIAEFALVASSFFLVCERVRLLMPDVQCAPILMPLAMVVAERNAGELKYCFYEGSKVIHSFDSDERVVQQLGAVAAIGRSESANCDFGSGESPLLFE